jgi:capsular exopolysaccharide synthesis family protein
MNRKVRTPADVERASRLQLLAGIPFLSGLNDVRGSSLVMTKADGTIGAEAFRMLRTAVQYANADRPRVIAVTSSGPGEGKSLISANFAIAMAKQGMNVLLVDADLRRPTIHKLFDIPHVPGLSDLLGGAAVTPLKPEQLDVQSLRVLPCGTHSTNPAELLSSAEFGRLVEKLRGTFDLVVIDTPPLLAVADATALLPFVDGTLLVARSERTDRFALGHAVALLRRAKSPVLGVVLNGIRKDAAMYSASGTGYYGYTYTDYYRSNGDEADADQRSLLERLLRRERV